MPNQAPEARRAADATMSWMRNSKRPINRIVANATSLAGARWERRARGGGGAGRAQASPGGSAVARTWQWAGNHVPRVVAPGNRDTAQQYTWSEGLRTDYGDRINDKARFYETLGVKRAATDKEIKKAYRRLAREHHPDLNPGNKEAERRFKEISEAYHVLSNAELRKKYDQFGHRAFEPGAGAGGGFDGTDFSNFNVRDFDFGKGGGGFGDIFENLFGQRRESQTRAATRGQDLQYTMEISFEDAARGVTAPISITRSDPCPECAGYGQRPSSRRQTCPECGGSGQRQGGMGFFGLGQACTRCEGMGTITGEPCSRCHGRGVMPTTERISVKIPPGVDTGSKIRVAGKERPDGTALQREISIS